MFDMIVRCPSCGGIKFEVIDVRNTNGMIYRRKRCLNCREKITTYEFIMDKKAKAKFARIDKLEAEIKRLKEELSVRENANFIRKQLELMETGEEYFPV